MKIGPTRYSPGESEIKAGSYGNGGLALFSVDENGQPELKLTVNLEEVGPLPPPGHVWLKGWSENEGVPAALEAAGAVRLTGRTHHLAHDAFAIEAELTTATLEWLKTQEEDDGD